ncbi:Hypp6190 [Branchiostoma lanceolatum]|uniref:Hypp6190 protein n=1 Tax=Branchiostoma lanceolatum TaxID=7740 RepID=A0A8J9YRW6_BRALA|nr:Hypp6190 [Branchiostoma lanceolatum]
MGESKKTPKSKTPTTKCWNININKLLLDETLTFDYEDEEKTRMCGVKLRSNNLEEWIKYHKDCFDRDFQDNKGTVVTWNTTPGTTSLSVTTTTQKTDHSTNKSDPSAKDEVTPKATDKQNLDRLASVEKALNINNTAFDDLQTQFVDLTDKQNALRDDWITKEREREAAHSKSLEDWSGLEDNEPSDNEVIVKHLSNANREKAPVADNSTRDTTNSAEIRIFADSIFRDVDLGRAFNGRSTKMHRNSTIKAAVENMTNIKDSKTKTVIIHLGSNDLDNSKQCRDSVSETLKKTNNLLAKTKESFPNAEVSISQVLQRGFNQTSTLNQNIKTYNQEMLKLAKKGTFNYIKHKKLTQDRTLYLADQIHLDHRSGTKLLVSDVKHSLNPAPGQNAGGRQPTWKYSPNQPTRPHVRGHQPTWKSPSNPTHGPNTGGNQTGHGPNTGGNQSAHGPNTGGNQSAHGPNTGGNQSAHGPNTGGNQSAHGPNTGGNQSARARGSFQIARQNYSQNGTLNNQLLQNSKYPGLKHIGKSIRKALNFLIS